MATAKLRKMSNMTKLTDYMLASALTANQLATKVKLEMQKGWTPLGGVAIGTSDGQSVFVQALVMP